MENDFIIGLFCGLLIYSFLTALFFKIYDIKNKDNPYVWVRKDELKKD